LKKKALIAVSAVLFAVSALVSHAAEPPVYSRYALNLPAHVVNLACEDMDGDGLKDVVAFTLGTAKKGAPSRGVHIYYQRKDSGFPSAPDQGFALDPRAAVFDVGAVSQGARKSIGFIAPDGVYAYIPNGRTYGTAPVQLVKAESVFAQADPLGIPRWSFFAGQAENGAETVLLPGINRIGVYLKGGPSYRLSGSIPVTVHTELTEGVVEGSEGPLTISHKLPVAVPLGWGGRKGSDLFITWDDKADVWLQRPGGGYIERAALVFRPGLLDTSKRDSLDSATVQAVDLDGDGRRDIIVTKMTGGIAQTKSLVFIYLMRKDGAFPQKPDHTIINEGVVGPRVADVDGDGRMDILLPSVKVGIRNFINMLTTKQIHMDIGVYLQDKNGRYPDRPTKEKGVDFKLNMDRLGKNTRPVMSIGKFTKTPGYGLAVVSDEDRVSVILPDRYSIFSDNPALKLKVDAPTEMEATDLNGDGIDDLVMSYRKDKSGKNRQVNIFLSR